MAIRIIKTTLFNYVLRVLLKHLELLTMPSNYQTLCVGAGSHACMACGLCGFSGGFVGPKH